MAKSLRKTRKPAPPPPPAEGRTRGPKPKRLIINLPASIANLEEGRLANGDQYWKVVMSDGKVARLTVSGAIVELLTGREALGL